MEEENQQQEIEEEMLQQVRSKATELLLREEYNDSIQHYSHFIFLSQQNLSNTQDPDQYTKLQKSLCLAYSNRAEARSKLRDFTEAILDCDQALKIESTHFKTLLCKGKILLNLNRYSDASNCFKLALSENGYLELSKKLEFQSKTGVFDLSEWVLNGFKGKFPELAEYTGCVEIKKSGVSGRGMFVTKNLEAGTVVLVTKAVAIGRGILPNPDEEDSTESARMVMWKDFIDKVFNAAAKCTKTQSLISMLSTGEEEEGLEIPDISLFRPETGEGFTRAKLEMGKIVKVLDVNSLTEDATSAKVLGKNSDYYGIGLWVLASFINHSCSPNARRLHIGDHVMVHISRDVKEGEEITLAYFDILAPLKKRREMSKTWGFECNCKRCRFEEVFGCREELREIQLGIEFGSDMGGVVFKLEEGMKRWMIRSREKGYLRASFWGVFVEVFKSEKCMRKWGKRIPTVEAIVESVAEVVGGDERMLKLVMERLTMNGGGGSRVEMMEKAMKLGKGVYGKVVKKQAMKALLELCIHS